VAGEEGGLVHADRLAGDEDAAGDVAGLAVGVVGDGELVEGEGERLGEDWAAADAGVGGAAGVWDSAGEAASVVKAESRTQRSRRLRVVMREILLRRETCCTGCPGSVWRMGHPPLRD
jgi:hypothetical protein